MYLTHCQDLRMYHQDPLVLHPRRLSLNSVFALPTVYIVLPSHNIYIKYIYAMLVYKPLNRASMCFHVTL